MDYSLLDFDYHRLFIRHKDKSKKRTMKREEVLHAEFVKH